MHDTQPLCDNLLTSIDGCNCPVFLAEGRQPGGSIPSEPELRSEFADDPEMAEILGLFLDELPGRIAAMARPAPPPSSMNWGDWRIR